MVILFQSGITDLFMTRLYYILAVDDWTDFWDLNIPESAYQELGQNANLETLIEFTDPTWALAISHKQPNFLTPIWIH